MNNIENHQRTILIGLMLPAMLMPLLSTMSRVALPVMRDTFSLTADLAAWIDIAFTMPFMMLMPIFGRLSDYLSTQRLLLIGIFLYATGTGIILINEDFSLLLIGRAVQGIGLSGMTPLCMSLITSLYPAEARGRALGTWSTIGPLTGFLGPFFAGFIVSRWGWQAAYYPPLISGLIALIIVNRTVPKPINARLGKFRSFVCEFDWLGVILLAGASSTFIIYLTSNVISGIPALQDYTIAIITFFLIIIFFIREKRCNNPFLSPTLFLNRTFMCGTFAASMRMVSMGTISFLIPIYLVDIKAIPIAQLGGLLMIGAGSMTIVVRLAGGLADRFGGRWLIIIGLLGQSTALFAFSCYSTKSSLWYICATLCLHGLAAGVMLATLHKLVMNSVPEKETGAAAGLYGMLRFLGAATGTALSGVMLQRQLDMGSEILEAYQQVFYSSSIFPAVGLFVTLITYRDVDNKDKFFDN